MNARPPGPKRKSTLVRSLRRARRYHRYLGIGLAALLTLSALTGVALAWKKQSDWLQPGTQRGRPGALADWRSLAELEAVAVSAFRQNAGPDADAAVDRMDVRPGKNVVKVRFDHDHYEVQLDGLTAEVLHVGQRNADWIEHLHDGSVVSEAFKLVSMNALGIGLLVLSATGLWLYYGPARVRASR